MTKIVRRTILLSFLATMSSPILTSLHAQTSIPSGPWSVRPYTTLCRGISSSMRGSITDFRREVGADYTNSDYPFEDGDWLLGNWGGELAYRFAESPFGLYLGGGWTEFNASDQGDRAHMEMLTGSLGAVYTIGAREERWNWFGRAGINASRIDGFVDYSAIFFGSFHTAINPAVRFGVEGEAGARYNIPRSWLSLEAALSYTNTNLIGKAYAAPAVRPPSTLKERELNDGADPGDPADHDRTIDFGGIRFGARISF